MKNLKLTLALLILVLLGIASKDGFSQNTFHHAGKKVRLSVTPPIVPVDVSNPQIAYNHKDNQYMVVWQKELAGQQSNKVIEGKIIGGTKPKNTIVNTFQIASGNLNNPNISYCETDNIFLVVWERKEKISNKPSGPTVLNHLEGRALDHKGNLLGKSIIDFNQVGTSPISVFDELNKAFLIIYENDDQLFGIWEPSSSAQAGNTQSANYFDLSVGSFANYPVKSKQPAITYGNDGTYLVVFSAEYFIEGVDHWGILGKWLPNDKPCPVGDPFQIGVYLKKGAKWQGAFNPSVAYDSKNKKYIAVWEDTRDYTTPYDNFAIYGGIIRPNSNTMLTTNYEIAPKLTDINRKCPQIEFDTKNNVFLVTWEQRDIYGQFLKLSGKQGKTFPIANAKRIQKQADLVFNPNTEIFFVVWQDNKDDPQPDIYGHRIKFK